MVPAPRDVSTASTSSVSRPSIARLREPIIQAEIGAVGWEIFSGLLFVSAVIPAVLDTVWPGVIFAASLALSVALSRPLVARGIRGFLAAATIRTVSWVVAISPLFESNDSRVIFAAVVFGAMAGWMRWLIYRRRLEAEDVDVRELRARILWRLTESSMMVGIIGGHILLLFSVAFLRTQSQIIFQAWFEIIPWLALIGTLGFALAVRPATSALIAALDAGPTGDRALLDRGLAQAKAMPDRLALLNFGAWLVCTSVGIFYYALPAAGSWTGGGAVGDAAMQLLFGLLFAVGVSFYQLTWHRDTLAPAVDRLRKWTSAEASAEPLPLRAKMLREFGLPLLFTCTLSLFSSVGLYRALGAGLSPQEDFNAILALFASFTMLVIAAGAVVARTAGQLSRPMTQLAQAANLVAQGKLDAVVPHVSGPIEVVGLGESIEGMRDGLARTIGELERERAGLEANVEARTAELRRALNDLRHAQAALVQGERLASIGELVSGVAHEIYNPLNAIAGASDPLERLVEELRTMMAAYREAEKDLPVERRRVVEDLRMRIDLDASLDDLVGISMVIRRATDRSVRIVQNLKSFSRLSGEALPTDLHAGIEETLALLGPRLRHAGIQVIKRYADLPPVVCRAGEMNQVFMNLLVNAIQALEAGAGSKSGSGSGTGDAHSAISTPLPVLADGCSGDALGQGDARESAIVIETWVEGDMATVAIADNGPGVPRHLAVRIFDPFFTTKPKGQGTGLGLSISSDIARRHGGSLTLEPGAGVGESDKGSGSRFVCRLPLSKRDAARSEPRAQGPA